jgi:hypothetical protein
MQRTIRYDPLRLRLGTRRAPHTSHLRPHAAAATLGVSDKKWRDDAGCWHACGPASNKSDL